eukprot:COSAG02_NODE_5202_length_4546_cov_1.544862_4_plen_64_part_00
MCGEPRYIENIIEELDAPMEWFYDITTAQLYSIHNATGMPPENLNFEAVTTKGQKKIPSSIQI